jgi:hypothetical protein
MHSFGEDVSDFTVMGKPSVVVTTMGTSITAALDSEANHGGKASKKGGTMKKSKALSKPLQILQKLVTLDSNDGDGNGFTLVG